VRTEEKINGNENPQNVMDVIFGEIIGCVMLIHPRVYVQHAHKGGNITYTYVYISIRSW